MKSTAVIKFIFSLSFCCCIILCSAQRDFKWDKKLVPSPPIPDSLTKEDAVMIYSHTTRKTLISYNSFFTRNIIRQRIKILTKSGLDEFGKVCIPKIDYLRLKKLDARTIKTNGSIVDLRAKEIKSIQIDEGDVYDQKDYLIFAVPGLEVGDEFEMICIYEGEAVQEGGNIFLHHAIPVLESTLTLEVDKDIVVLSKGFNDMPDPEVKQKLGTISFKWTLKNLEGVFDQRASIFGTILPFFIYELYFNRFYENNSIISKSWVGLIQSIAKRNFKYKIRKREKFDQLMESIFLDKAINSALDSIKVFHQYINDEFTISPLNRKEESKGLSYFLENKKADQYVLLQIYIAFFEHYNIPFYLATARTKYGGEIELTFPTKIQITHYLFAFNDGQGNHHVCLPKTNNKYYSFNEMPLSLEGTVFYMLDMQDKSTLKKIRLASSPHQNNVILRKINTNVSLSASLIEQVEETTFSGIPSTIYRSHYYDYLRAGQLYNFVGFQLNQRQPDAFLFDAKLSSYPTKPPFTFTLSQAYTLKHQIEQIEEDVYKISLKDWFSHHIKPINVKKRLLDYYPNYAGIDAFQYTLEFEKDIQLINESEQLAINIEYEIGSYTLVIRQIGNKSIQISSKYVITAHHIPVDKVGHLEGINQAVKQANGSDIYIKVK